MTDLVEFVTSVSLPYFEKYGRRLVATFLRFAPPTATLRVYCEVSTGVTLESYSLPPDAEGRVVCVDLHAVTPLLAFLERARPRVEAKLGRGVPIDPDERRPENGYDYTWDAVTFGKKGFSLAHALVSASARFVFWIDADVVFLDHVPVSFLVGLFQGRADLVYFGRVDLHSETGFIGFDLHSPRTRQFARAHEEFWHEDAVFTLKDGWTDCHVFDKVLQRATANDGLIARSLSRQDSGHVMATSILSPYLDHLKGARKELGRSPEQVAFAALDWRARLRLRGEELRRRLGPVRQRLRRAARRLTPWRRPSPPRTRYDQILELIGEQRPSTILEVGAWNGGRAEAMSLAALRRVPRVSYFGFDLFEHLTPEVSALEFNVKTVPSMQEVSARLKRFAATNPRFDFTLYQGPTKVTLPQFLREHGERCIDFVWLDGGHSVETVDTDWSYCRRAVRAGGLILLDDYYIDMPAERLARVGCNELVERLRTVERLPVTILPVADAVAGGGKVQIAMVRLPAGASG